MFELFQPFIGSLNSLWFLIFICQSKSLLRCMVHDILQILWVHCIQNIEKIFSIRTSFLRKIILKEAVEVFISLQIRPHLFHRQFFPVRNWYVVDLFFLEKPLFILKDSFKKIFVNLSLRLHIVLNYKGIRFRKRKTYDVYPSKHKSLSWI